MTYCYTTKDGKTNVERQFPMGAAKKRVTLPDGRKAFRDLSAEHLSGRRTKDPWVDHLSTALGCAPKQRKDFRFT